MSDADLRDWKPHRDISLHEQAILDDPDYFDKWTRLNEELRRESFLAFTNLRGSVRNEDVKSTQEHTRPRLCGWRRAWAFLKSHCGFK